MESGNCTGAAACDHFTLIDGVCQECGIVFSDEFSGMVDTETIRSAPALPAQIVSKLKIPQEVKEDVLNSLRNSKMKRTKAKTTQIFILIFESMLTRGYVPDITYLKKELELTKKQINTAIKMLSNTNLGENMVSICGKKKCLNISIFSPINCIDNICKANNISDDIIENIKDIARKILSDPEGENLFTYKPNFVAGAIFYLYAVAAGISVKGFSSNSGIPDKPLKELMQKVVNVLERLNMSSIVEKKDGVDDCVLKLEEL